MKFSGAIFFIFLQAILASSSAPSAFAQPNSARSFLNNSRLFENNRLIRDDVFSGTTLNLDQLHSRLTLYSKPADVLADLIKTQPAYQSNVVLMFGSESQQLSTPAQPRLLIFGSGMIFGFGEHSGSRVEIAQLNKKDHSVTLAEIRFEGQKAILDRQPKSCLSCHGNPSRLLWEPYDFWQGAYGANAGRFNSDKEKEAFNQLLADQNKSPLLSQLRLQDYLKPGAEKVTEFTQFVSIANLNQYAAKLKLDTNHPNTLRLLSVLSLCHPNVEDFFTQTFSDKERPAQQEAFNQMKEQWRRTQGQLHSASDRRYKSHLTLTNEATLIDRERLQKASGDLHILALWLLAQTENPLDGIGLSLHGNLFDFHTPSQMAIELMTSVVLTQPSVLKDLKVSETDLFTGTKSWLQADCQQLKSSLDRVSAGSPQLLSLEPIYFQLQSESPSVIRRCASCHSESQGQTLAPYIPFERPLLLASWLKDPKLNFEQKIINRIEAVGTKRQMPPTQSLSAEETESLKEYLRVLKE